MSIKDILVIPIKELVMGLFSTIKESLSKHDCGKTCVKCTGVYIPERTTAGNCKKYAPCYHLVYGESHEKCAARGCCDCMKVLQYNPPRGKLL